MHLFAIQSSLNLCFSGTKRIAHGRQRRTRASIAISVGDPDPGAKKDPHHFAGSGSEIFSTDPDPNLKLNLKP